MISKVCKRPAIILDMLLRFFADASSPSTFSEAAFVGLPSPTAETPGIALDPDTGPLTGTVLANLRAPSSTTLPTPFATGTLLSLVVDREGGLLDF